LSKKLSGFIEVSLSDNIQEGKCRFKKNIHSTQTKKVIVTHPSIEQCSFICYIRITYSEACYHHAFFVALTEVACP